MTETVAETTTENAASSTSAHMLPLGIRKFIIACDIRTTAPLHITAIEKGAYNPERQQLQRSPASKAQGGFIGTSLTRTAAILEMSKLREYNKSPVKTGVAVATEEDGEPIEQAEAADTGWSRFVTPIVPIIPSSTLGGVLRRRAAELIMDSLVERDHTLSVDAYNTLTSGTATTSILSASMDGMRAARFDPFLGNFGGTTFMLSAGTVISDGWPILKMTESRHMSPPILAQEPLAIENINDMTDVWQVVRKNDAQSMTDLGRLTEVVGMEKLSEYLGALNEQQATSKVKKAAGELGTKTDLRTLNGMETVRSGMPFALRVGVKQTTPAHLGLMILAMQRFLIQGQVGGKAARGMGQFTCTSSQLLEIDPTTGKVINKIALFEEKSTGYALVDDAELQAAVDAATDYIENCDPELYTAFADGNDKALQARVKPPKAKGKAKDDEGVASEASV